MDIIYNGVELLQRHLRNNLKNLLQAIPGKIVSLYKIKM